MSITEHIVVIGASAGGLEALKSIVRDLSPCCPAAFFVTVHIGAHKSELPWILGRAGALPAVHPSNGEPIEPGKIYVAPPDHHMTLSRGTVGLNRGPRENWARPAIDPMFRSAARAYADRVIGVVLTGGLNDGTAGLFEIKHHGGVTVVQDPFDALNAEMPQSAIAHVEIDHVAPIAAMGQLLSDLVRTPRLKRRSIPITPTAQEPEMTDEFTLARPVAITCPDCGGALRQSMTGTLRRFTCHIGHAYTAEVMLTAQFIAMEQSFEAALRSLNERAEMCRLMEQKSTDGQASRWIAAREEASSRAQALKELLLREWTHPDPHQRPPHAPRPGAHMSQ